MKIIKIIVIILLCIILNGCTEEIKTEDYPNLLICGAYAVPGIFYPDLKGSETDYKIIETDSFDRVLFEFITPCFITGETESVFVICQKADSDYVYFYEDVCFSFDTYNDLTVNLLKEANDWNKELNVDKMTKRPIIISFDGFIMSNNSIEYSEILKLCHEKLGFSGGNIQELCVDDVDTKGNEILYFKLKNNNGITEYFLFVSTDLNYDLFEITDFPSFNVEEFSQFKIRNGWT
ncbi:MAG: hypothetical protein E7573_02700 [Ruminococcaceae bacterium]|nr:hypothetical protein [Oscillospiraceae bacterium]